MSLQFFCPRWGSEDLPWEAFCRAVKEAGYDGIEYAIDRTTPPQQLHKVWDTAEAHGLTMIPQHYDTYEANYADHLELYQAWLQKIKPFPAVKINSQTGKDFFTFQQNASLINMALNTGLPIVHETHRNKFSFAAHITRQYLEAMPHLRLTLDASHWVNVAESYLQDQQETMELAISRTDHIHARIGYPEGPQVPDPRVPEWKEALATHLHWWDQVVQLKQQQGAPLTITPEFGPHPYMVHLPGTGLPLTDQWAINAHMLHLLKKRYAPTLVQPL